MTSGFELPPYPLAEFHSYTLPSSTREGERIQNHEFPRVVF